jgi:hypothetical protein
MADTPRVVKSQKQIDDWARRQAQTDSARAEAAERRQKLFTALNSFISSQGGWVVSTPGAKNLRIECVQGSALPAKLIELGYSPRHCGASTRITGTGGAETITDRRTGNAIIRRHDGIIPVDIIEITLGA